MQFYLSGIAGKGEFGMINAADTQLPLLVDPVDLKQVTDWHGSLALDSGAYRAFKKETTIDINHYLDAAHSRAFDFVVAPDVIGNPQQTLENWLAVKDIGLNLVPTWEWGADQSFLRRYLDEAPLVGIGGLVPIMRLKNKGPERKIKDQMLIELSQLCQQFPNRFHIFGLNWLWAIESLQDCIASGDSSKWLDGARYAHVIFTNSKTGHLSQAPAKCIPEAKNLDRKQRCVASIQAIANFTQSKKTRSHIRQELCP